MTTSLQPGTLISRYRVLSSLGAGGMGEVYLARDETLGRNIAFKILPPELVANEDRVRRFVQEAKSASSLSHPHIVTIHEIGQAETSSGGPAIHFIAMELVEGSTLRSLIHQEKTELRTLLRYLAQAADGLSKAHAAGIVHRDLKPDNIMVTRDGYAKVLDFGLAKLTERQPVSPDDRTSAETATERVTGEGAVMGTVGYMSPEQAQGKAADHRSDIFSFGCILYEAATRKRPFTGDSDIEVLHKILKEQPAPVEEINAQVPAEVRRLIRRCLAKETNQRLDSMKALAIELGEIADEYDTLSVSPSAPGGATSGSRAASPEQGVGPRRWRTLGLVALSVVILAVATYAILHMTRGRPPGPPEAAPAVVRITPVTNRGDVGDAALSPDGRYVAYTSGLEGRQGLRVHQINTGSDVEILPAGTDMTSPHLSFSADGDRLYFFRDDPADSEHQTLLEVPSLGGVPRELARVGFNGAVSPDGKRVCFLRRVQEKGGAAALVVLDLARMEERVLTTEKTPIFWFSSRPAWSADGRRIALGHVANGRAEGGTGKIEIIADVTIIDASTGKLDRLFPGTWRIQNLEWMPDASGLILSALDPGGIGVQAWYLPATGGPARKITNDSNRYWRVTTSFDGRTIAAIRAVAVSNVWTAGFLPGHAARQLTFAATPDNAPVNMAVTRDGAVYTAGKVPDRSFWKVAIDGSTQRLVTPSGDIQDLMLSLPNGDLLFNSRVERDGTFHVIHADAFGDHARPVTSGPGEELLAASPDGKTILYLRLDQVNEMWAVSIDGGSPRRVADGLDFTADLFPKFSPDGRRIFAPVQPVVGSGSGPTLGIFSISGGAPMATLALAEAWKDLEWDPDGNSLTFVSEAGGVGNVFRQPLDGRARTQVTHFPEGKIVDHEWSPRGDRILLARTLGRGCEVAATAANGGRSETIARFETGQLWSVAWTQDGKAALFMYGTAGRDAVLIRDFR